MNQNLSATMEYARRELARRHYADYLAYSQGAAWKRTRMSTFLADQVQEFIEADTGHAYDVLVVNCPSQHGKSMTITESLPSWYLGKHPGNNVIIASYDSDFAERFCKKNKEKIRNVGGRLFGIEIGAIDRAAEFELAPKLLRGMSAGGSNCGNTTSMVRDGGCSRSHNLTAAKQSQRCQMGDGSPGHLIGDRMKTVPTDMLTGTVPTDMLTAVESPQRQVDDGRAGADARQACGNGESNCGGFAGSIGGNGYIGGGRLIARGIMSGITGNPANLVIIDDPVKNQLEADSPTYRQRLWGEWQASIKSRLAANAKIIVIMTPWREDCFDREVLRTEPNARHISLPVEAGENDPLGRAVGEPLCPELGKDEKWLSEFRESYINDPLGGQRAWAAMYLCSPRVQDGNLIKREWWKFYSKADTPAEFGTEVISVDAAFKDAETNDYVSIQVWGKRRNDYYLRYCMNRHLNFPDTVEAIRSVSKLYPRARMILIEEAANGAAIIQTLQRELFILPVTPKGGKVARVNAVSAAIESGHVFLPYPYMETKQTSNRNSVKSGNSDFLPNDCTGYTWVNDFIEQWTTFPNAKHDDMVDAGSQALSRLFECSGEVFQAGIYVNPPIDLEAMYDSYA